MHLCIRRTMNVNHVPFFTGYDNREVEVIYYEKL